MEATSPDFIAAVMGFIGGLFIDPFIAFGERPDRPALEDDERVRSVDELASLLDEAAAELGHVARAVADEGRLDEFMTSDSLVTAPAGTDLEEAVAILHRHRIEKLPLVDDDGVLCGLIQRDLRGATGCSRINRTSPSCRSWQLLFPRHLGCQTICSTS